MSTNKAQQQLCLKFGGNSVKGRKTRNEDAFTALLPTEASVRKYKGAAACIADGVSCSDNAQLASQTAVTNFISDYFSTPDYWNTEQSASKVISAINSWLYQQNRQSRTNSEGFVTTFSVLIVKSHTAHILHVGDSRIYLLRNNELRQLTNDHHYQRGGEDYLTRALGIEGKLSLDYCALRTLPGDRFLLTTDGVHSAINEQQLYDLGKQPLTDLEELASVITQTALSNGSDDNVSCLITDVESLPIEQIEEVYQELTQLIIPPVLGAGNTIDHFEIIRSIHSGTRSHVYLARDKQCDELRVLKMPSLNFSDDMVYLESFAREQWIGRKLSHPLIMKVYAPPQETRFLYHVCEYIEGISLRQWMIDNPKPELKQIRDLLDAMIAPVRAMHRNKMIHRDLKPENFIIDTEGRITLIDFGTIQVAGIEEINRENISEMPVGDIGYIAPEYLVYGVTNHQSDLYSIACIIYEMIANELPYNAIKTNRNYPDSFSKWKYKSLNTLAIPPENTPNWIDQVLKKSLAPNPKHRYQALSEFQAELRSPSKELLQTTQQMPLIERNPLRFWQVLSGLFLLVIFFQWIVLSR